MDAMWHAWPRGRAMQTCESACVALRWHLYVYIYFITYGYSTNKHAIEELANRYNSLTLYTRQCSLFFSVWDYVPLIFVIAGRMT